MYNTCYRFFNNKEQAEDILQESFTEAFANLKKFRYESSFGAWLKKIVVNKCINELKRKKIRLEFTDNFPVHEYDDDNEPETLNYNLEVKKILNAIEKLSPGYKIILSLYLFEGYDHTEIAQILNISESTSKSQYMRAKKRLKEILINN